MPTCIGELSIPFGYYSMGIKKKIIDPIVVIPRFTPTSHITILYVLLFPIQKVW